MVLNSGNWVVLNRGNRAAVYLAPGVLSDGTRDVGHLDLANRRGQVLVEGVQRAALPRRPQRLGGGNRDCVPNTTVQTCIVHLIRNSLDYASWKERKAIARALRPIYAPTTAEAVREALGLCCRPLWGGKYPTIVQSWRRAWKNVIFVLRLSA